MTRRPAPTRSDTIERKLGLLADHYRAGRLDLAMALADSIKDGLRAERMWATPAGTPIHSGPADFVEVAALPGPWARWARGWSRAKPVRLSETVGIGRTAEPVAIGLAFPTEHSSDPRRDLRVARVEADGSLREVVSQVEGVTRDPSGWRCRVLIQADVPAHETASYLVFLGNPAAERPGYVTDLRVEGEGYGLEISNHHYVARLSRQMGQLERLTSRREHGLELYAGGKGHGEPPCIDWAHDYVDQGNFQKLRLRNWAACPNFEVERGPLAVTVRRWGFPHSPVHPLFTPARIHIDQSYTFHAGQPYFLKESRFDVLQDVAIEASRDDEWVFSGYSFDRILWLDARGKLHEGPVPPESEEAIWGVGFRNTTSRDAFVALRLVHEATGFDGISHGGSPTLHYDGHGQLWSRYPAQQTTLRAGTVLKQKNAYQLSGYPEGDGAGEIEALRHRLMNPLASDRADLPVVPEPRASGSLARPGETPEDLAAKAPLWEALRLVKDEQLYSIDANVVDLGLVYDLSVRHRTVFVTLTMPHRGRPVHTFFETRGGGRVADGIRERLMALPGVRDVVVDLTWLPAWGPERLTDQGRQVLGLA